MRRGALVRGTALAPWIAAASWVLLALHNPSLAATGEGALAAASLRLQSVRAVSVAANQAAAQARELSDAADAVNRQFAAVHGPEAAQAQQAVADAQACLEALEGTAAAARHRSQQVLQALDAAHRAVADTASASARKLAPAKAAADAAFARRDAAEQALLEVEGALASQASACRSKVLKAAENVTGLRRDAADLVRSAQALAPALAALPGALAAAEQARLDSGGPGAAMPPLPALTLSESASLPLLLQMLSSVAAQPGPPPVALNLQPVQPKLVAAWADFARLSDAAAFMDLSGGAPPCARPGCRSGAQTRRELALRQADARLALNAAMAQAEAISQPQQAAQATARSTLDATVLALDAAQPVLPSTLAEFRAAAQRAGEAVEPLRLSAATAVREAQAAWVLAGGRVPSPPAPAPAAVAPSPLVFDPPGAGVVQVPRGHAWSVFRTLGTRPGMGRQAEPEGFGAYTYVVVDGDALLDPEVRDRFATVVRAVMAKASQAASVGAVERKQVNVFCFPSSTGASSSVADLVNGYSDELGKALRLRAQTGLLTRPELRALFVRGQGPFLLTLPNRAGESRSNTPVLLADLSTYPADAIRDLVERYMDDLLQDFPQAQASWRPPVAMKVALTLVSWATGPARVVSGLVPTAQARTPRRP